MGIPGLVPGGEAEDEWADAIHPSYVPYQSMGVFAKFPGATPKYALNHGPRDAEYRETMARLYVEVPPKERTAFVNSCPPETRELAKVLCGAAKGAAGGTGFIDFLLTDIQEPFQEKVQVVESLSDNFVVYTFGQSAPRFSYSGVLLNTWQDDQRVWMLRLYRDILRSTQLARRRKLARLRYDSVIVSGVFIMHSQGLTAQMQTMASFQFQFIPMQYVIYTPAVGIPTQLETAFTEGGAYGLSDATTPDDDELQVAAAEPENPTAQPAATAPTPADAPPAADTPSTTAPLPVIHNAATDELNARYSAEMATGRGLVAETVRGGTPPAK